MEIKDRIRQIMEGQHMSQQVFADFLQQSPATLSSIFNGRTRPTLQVIDAIKTKIPDISIEWLLYGSGDMYIAHPEAPIASPSDGQQMVQEQTLNFDAPVFHAPSSAPLPAHPASSVPVHHQSVNNTHLDLFREEMKNVDKEPRRVTEIRIYYDDQTYETFVPSKK